VRFLKMGTAVFALLMLTHSLALTQDVAQQSSSSTQDKPPDTATVPALQEGGTTSSPAKNQPAENQSAKNESMDAMPRKYVEMWNTGNLQPIAMMFTHPVFITFHGQKKFLDTGTLAKVISSWRKSMPDLNFTIEDTIVQGDRVAMRLTFTGTYKERLFSETAAPESTPGKIHALEMLMFLIRDGKIAEIWDDYDELVMRYQMGGVWRSNKELGACPCKPSAQSRLTPFPSLQR